MSHWYTENGSSCHEITGASGKLRPTTLRDARKLQLYPSYSTIVQAVLAKPGLDMWKQNQLLDACSTYPYDVFDEAGWRKKVTARAAEKSRKAAERGTEIHDKMEQAIISGIDKYKDDVDYKFIEPIYEFVMSNIKQKIGIELITESSFTHSLGYAGRVDLCSPTNEGIVLDFKTKEFTKETLSKVQVYSEHGMQLSAYREGLGLPKARCYNLFISVTEPGTYKLIEHEEEELQKSFNKFKCLLEYWQIDNNYKPVRGL